MAPPSFGKEMRVAPSPARGGRVKDSASLKASVQSQPAPNNPPTKEDLAPKGRRWSFADGSYWQARSSCDMLPCGLYACDVTDQGPTLRSMEFDIDDLLELPDTASSEVIEEIKRFWTLKDKFAERGFTFKTGALFWGPPGSGKSSAIQLLITDIIKNHNGIAIMVQHPQAAIVCLQTLRKIEPDRPVIALLEDFDALVEKHGETEFLAMLDGEARVGNVVYLAATNYPERLDARFVDRPSRFSIIKEIGMPSAAARNLYLRTKDPSLTDEELSEWVEKSEGYSIDHLREMIVLCKCHEMHIDKVIERINEMREEPPKSNRSPDGKKKALGFR